MDMLDLDRRALASTGAFVDALRPDDLGRPTPCSDWDVRALLDHVLGNNARYAAAVTGQPVDWDRAEDDRVGDDPRRAYARSAHAVLAAFGAADLAVELDLPFGRVAAAQALAVHFVDVLAHGWDLAVATGQDPALDPDLVDVAVDIVGFYPPDVWGTARFFADRVAAPEGAPPHARLAALLGRDPAVTGQPARA